MTAPPAGPGDRLRAVVRQTVFVGLVEQDVPLGLFTVKTSARQLHHRDDEDLRRHLQEQLIAIARRLAAPDAIADNGRAPPDSPNKACLALVDAALSVSLAAGSSHAAIAAFVELIERLAAAWPAMAPARRPITQRPVEELPPPQARLFWRLVIRLRTADTQPDDRA